MTQTKRGEAVPAAYLRDIPGGCEADLLIQPRASKTGIVGEHDGRLKIRLAAPPVDGAANDELVRWLADILGIPKRNVSLISGETGRRKRVRLAGITAAEAKACWRV